MCAGSRHYGLDFDDHMSSRTLHFCLLYGVLESSTDVQSYSCRMPTTCKYEIAVQSLIRCDMALQVW
jgi:hypothetical protein